jgi:ATP-dependent DNA helicase RecG
MNAKGRDPVRIDADRVRLLIQEGEGLTVEFKEKYTPRIDEDIVAFSNGKGGTVLLGVRDDGGIAGDRLTNDLKARINSLARNCKPEISVKMVQSGEVIAVEVEEGTNKPYSCGSGYYRRLNGTTQKMSHEELRVMFVENEPVSFEGRIARGFAIDGISKGKIRAFIREADVSIGRAPVVDFLRSLNVADQGGIKNVGVLFFAADPYKFLNQSQMTLAAFKGIEKLHIYDRRDVRDDLLTQFNEAMSFIKKNLNVRSEIRDGVNREDIYEIPLEVMREAVVNALMHRDYSIAGTQINVEVYDDRVEIINPGGLPRGITRAKLGSISLRRNELIADLFFRLGKVEKMGMGIKKMREAMARSGLRPPEFEANGFFRAVFYRSPDFALKGKIPGAEKDGKPTREKTREITREKTGEKILALIGANPEITTTGLAKETGLTDKGIEWNINRLKESGRLRRVGPDKGGHWEVIQLKAGKRKTG